MSHPGIRELDRGLSGVSFWALGDQSQIPGRDALPVCLGTAAMILSVESGHRPVIARILSVKPLLFIGAISYSLYLWHWPMIALYQYSIERPIAWWETALLIVASVGVATASWRWIETPWRRPVEGRRANISFEIGRASCRERV